MRLMHSFIDTVQGHFCEQFIPVVGDNVTFETHQDTALYLRRQLGLTDAELQDFIQVRGLASPDMDLPLTARCTGCFVQS
jgi:hypothetical protein